MIIDCISDLHGYYPKTEGGDLLIVAGDLTARDRIPEWYAFYEWLRDQKYRKKVYIAGNHDGFLSQCLSTQDSKILGLYEDEDGMEFLMDSGTEFEGLKIWGSPWTPMFCNWHFMLERGKPLREKWALIPDDTDILVTHGPPFGMLDKNCDGERCGCRDLANRVLDLNLKLHVFGHIHDSHGECHQSYETPGDAREVVKDGYKGDIPKGHLSVNASHVNDGYKPVNKPIRVILS